MNTSLRSYQLSFPCIWFAPYLFHLKINHITPCGISHFHLLLYYFTSYVYVLHSKMDHESSEADLIFLYKPLSIQTLKAS